MPFDGETYDRELDGERLSSQLQKVKQIMGDYRYHTLGEMASRLDATEQSVSARVRDLRKRKFGSHDVLRRRVPNGNGLHEYRLIGPDEDLWDAT